MELNGVQLRVLGALIEKEIATPEGYPLSLNALVNACNQRSSRDPVMDLSEEEVRQALHALEELGLTAAVRDSRVAKYEHRVRTVLNLRRDETAVLCLLLLRRAQTPGELRTRAERLYRFDDLEAVQATLDRLASRPAISSEEPGGGERNSRPLVVVLPRQPGSREARYMHLLGGPIAAEPSAARGGLSDGPEATSTAAARSAEARLRDLEAEIAGLHETVASIEARVAAMESKARDLAVE
jgi:uncharacterized protein YceH (UPF0502 family)